MQKKDIEYEKQLSDVQLDRGKKVVIAGKEYNSYWGYQDGRIRSARTRR